MDTLDPYRTPEGRVEDIVIDGPGTPLAERGTRLLARIVDGLIIMVPMFVLIFALSGLSEEPGNEMIYVAVFIPMLLAFLVNLYFLAQNGQTMGKKVLGVKIVRLNREPAGLGRIVLLRMFAPGIIGWVPVVGLIFGITNILFIFRDDRRCVHDWMADTVVVKA